MYCFPTAMFGSGGSDPLKVIPVKVVCPVKAADGGSGCGCAESGPRGLSEGVERSWERRGGGVTLSCHDAEGGMSGRSERRGESAGPDRSRTLDAASAAASSPGSRAEMPATVIVKPRATDHRSHRVPIGSSSLASLDEEETWSDTPLFRGGLNSARLCGRAPRGLCDRLLGDRNCHNSGFERNGRTLAIPPP
jgi:hypothetical protein